ncbi:MAG: beta-galactosidase [Bacteroidaceae bacterium]
MKSIIPIMTLVIAMTAMPMTAKRHKEQKPQIPILAWYSIPAGEFATVERYQELRDAGFTLSFSHIYSYEDAVKALDLCAQTGLKSVFMCPELESEPETTVSKVRKHPGLGAYFLRDEPGNQDMPALAEWARRIESVDKEHPCYLNLLPVHAFASGDDYKSHVQLFDSLVNLPQISYDHYPINQIGDSVFLNGHFWNNLEIVFKEAKLRNKPFWAFALATAHGSYPIPTADHLRLQLYADLAYGAQCLQYFTYWNPGTETWNFHQAPVMQDGRRSPVYEIVKQINQEIQARADVFAGARVTSVYHTGNDIPIGTQHLTTLPQHILHLDTHGQGALVSCLTNNGTNYVVIQNTSVTTSLQVEIITDQHMKLVMPDGTRQPASLYGTLHILTPGNVIIFEEEK